jgi:hypothetical protein
LLALLKWPAVACLLVAGFYPHTAAARSPVSAEYVEKYVRTHAPALVGIARCESRFRQFEADGSPLYNKQGSSAVGVMQIMSSVHDRRAKDLGYDIKTLEGNVGYAEVLYNEQGRQPWKASASCWS